MAQTTLAARILDIIPVDNLPVTPKKEVLRIERYGGLAGRQSNL